MRQKYQTKPGTPAAKARSSSRPAPRAMDSLPGARTRGTKRSTPKSLLFSAISSPLRQWRRPAAGMRRGLPRTPCRRPCGRTQAVVRSAAAAQVHKLYPGRRRPANRAHSALASHPSGPVKRSPRAAREHRRTELATEWQDSHSARPQDAPMTTAGRRYRDAQPICSRFTSLFRTLSRAGRDRPAGTSPRSSSGPPCPSGSSVRPWNHSVKRQSSTRVRLRQPRQRRAGLLAACPAAPGPSPRSRRRRARSRRCGTGVRRFCRCARHVRAPQGSVLCDIGCRTTRTG